MQLFYHKNIQSKDVQFTFDKLESKHIVKVLRKKVGDNLYITNGHGFLFISEISIANDKKCVVNIIKEKFHEQQFNYTLHIAIAPTKNNQRLEWFLEKATEIGISEITPIVCDNSERKIIKKERLEKVLVSAMKQSNRFYLPKLNDIVSFKKFMNQEVTGDLFIAHCEETKKVSFKSQLKTKNKITLLIGPEGDFSTSEIKQAIENHHYKAVSLGNSRLRTETAAIIAVHSVAFYNEK